MDNLELMRKRLEHQGGILQEDRMIKDKWNTFQRTLKYSYQAGQVERVQRYDEVLPIDWVPVEETQPIYQALINADKVKQEYDDKVLSIDYATGYGPGDIFEWKKTNSYWIIYTQEMTEDAYFRGEIRRCKYRINFKGKDGNFYSTWAAVRGPVETQIISIQKNQERIDQPNLSLNILIPKNDLTLAAFERYDQFLFAGRCWRVEAPDSISMTNVIEVNAEEYYINETTDDQVCEIKDGLVIEPINPTPSSGIEGNTFIKPKISEIFSVDIEGGEWDIVENVPVRRCIKDNGKSIELYWDKMISGQFTLHWCKNDDIREKVVVVESLY